MSSRALRCRAGGDLPPAVTDHIRNCTFRSRRVQNSCRRRLCPGCEQDLDNCRREAAAFMTCVARSPDGPANCQYETTNYQACADECFQQVVADLMAIAASRCKAEVAAHHACLSSHGAAGCEHTDTAALSCAAGHVVRSAQKSGASTSADFVKQQ